MQIIIGMKMYKRVAVLSISILLASCSTISHQDQRKWESVSCSGFKGWDSCMKQALLSCNKGFDVRDQQENQVTQERTMLFACK